MQFRLGKEISILYRYLKIIFSYCIKLSFLGFKTPLPFKFWREMGPSFHFRSWKYQIIAFPASFAARLQANDPSSPNQVHFHAAQDNIICRKTEFLGQWWLQCPQRCPVLEASGVSSTNLGLSGDSNCVFPNKSSMYTPKPGIPASPGSL